MKITLNKNAKKISPFKWEIYITEPINIKPNQSWLVNLGVGVEFPNVGYILVDLSNKWKEKPNLLSIQNNIILNSTTDIPIILKNNGSQTISIISGSLLCTLVQCP